MDLDRVDRYQSRYPRQGDIALLCEGDVVGYETDMLEKWSAKKCRDVIVDVWPCGTKSSIFGVSDAIGRSRHVGVVEDRDFRTQSEANRECERLKKDRTVRGVRVLFWRTWRRNEIENYLLEPGVVAPVLSAVFKQDEDAILERLDSVITSQYVDQAAQHAIWRFRSGLPSPDRFIPGLPRAEVRPKWNQKERAFDVPSREDVEEGLEQALRDRFKAFERKVRDEFVGEVLSTFSEKVAEWSNMSADDQIWRLDWAGKEILTALCRCLTGEFGWPMGDSTEGQGIPWDDLTASGHDEERDREIAYVLQPRFVSGFIQFLEDNEESDIFEEWAEIADNIGRLFHDWARSGTQRSSTDNT